MGNDKVFKNRKKQLSKRKSEVRMPKANSYLIVTEGERTEPLYFSGIKKLIEKRLGGVIDIKNTNSPSIKICGEGKSTNRLIEITEKLVKESKILYQNIWVVFDKDDFDDFDEAIAVGESKGYNVAWSNQCFEYWIFLHFSYSDSALHRDEWKDKLNDIFKKFNIKNGKYEKNYEDIYEILNVYGSSKKAYKYAEKRMENFASKKHLPSNYNPGTTVHKLVNELEEYLTE